MSIYKNEIISIVDGQGYEIMAIIQHGSTVMGVSEDNSDTDFLVIVNSTVHLEHKELPIVSDNGSKIHISCIQLDAFKDLLGNFYKELAMSVLDVNLLAGRVIQGKIIHDPFGIAAESIKNLNPFQCPKYLIEKFMWQSFGFIKDARHSNKYIKQNCVEKAVDSWGIAVLLKNSITTLNLKWQPILLEKCLTPDIFEAYVTLRFNYSVQSNDDINRLLKILIDFLRRELNAYKSSNFIY